MNDIFHEPANSPKLARLREVANERGIDTTLLDKLVGLLQSPGSLIRFSVVVSNLAAALDEAETTWNGILARLDLSWLPTFLKELVPVAAALNIDDKRASRRVGDSEEKLLTEHPLYMAFAQRSEHGPRQLRNYRKLQAHHFFGHLKASGPSVGVSETKKELISKDAPYKAGLGMRALSGADQGHKREVAEILVNLPLDFPPDEFAGSARIELSLELGNKGLDWSKQYVDYIAVFLEQAYGKEEPRKRSASRRVKAGVNVWSAALPQAKNDGDGLVCANVYGLYRRVSPGHDGMRCALVLLK